MKDKILKRGRKPLPVRERKVKVYILVKKKFAKMAQEDINQVAISYNNLN